MNGQNSWMGWAIAIAVLVYWLVESNATSAANANQVGVPPGSKVIGSTVYNSAGQVIGTVTSAGYYYPTLATTTASSNPLTGTTVNQAGSATLTFPLGPSSQAVISGNTATDPSGQVWTHCGSYWSPGYGCNLGL